MPFIVIIESHPLIRLGLLRLLPAVSSKVIIKGYAHDDFNVEKTKVKNCDLVLIAINPCENSEKQILNINNRYVPSSILLFSEDIEIPNYLLELSPSISGVIYKDTSPEILTAAVRLALAGGTCFPTQQKSKKSDYCFSSNKNGAEKQSSESRKQVTVNNEIDEASILGITPRQYEVLVLLSKGNSLKEISKHLNISIATAKAHTETLYQRLNVNNRNEAVYIAVSRGATLGWSNLGA